MSRSTSTERSSSSETSPQDARRGGRRLEILAAGFLPGLLAGTLLTGLLYFLNPQLPFALGPVFRGAAAYGFLLGLLSLLVQLPWTYGYPARARRLLPWVLLLVLAGFAALAWLHGARHDDFLPPGIRQRLLKAALWASIAAVICFYTALLHEVGRRPYGGRSLSLLALLSLLTASVVLERREAFRPGVAPSPRPTLVQGSPFPFLAVVGVSSATLDAVLPLTQQGRLPFLAKLLDEGAYGRLSALLPTRADTQWTTLDSGKLPYRHRVLGSHTYAAPLLGSDRRLSLLPMGIGFREWGLLGRGQRIDSRQRQALSLWQILARLGFPVATIGWPLTYPVAPEVQQSVSDRYFARPAEIEALLSEDLRTRAALFRPRQGELPPDLVAGFGDAVPDPILESLTADLWRRDLTQVLLEENPELQALFLVLPGLVQVSESYYGAYAAARFEGAQEIEIERGAQLLETYYSLVDSWLADLWQRLPEPKILAVVSPSGVRTRSWWLELRSGFSADAAHQGRLKGAPDGLVILFGEGIQARQMPRAELVDLVPTLLYGLGLPVARDLDGTVLAEAFTAAMMLRHPLTIVPSYETLERQAEGGSRERLEGSAE